MLKLQTFVLFLLFSLLSFHGDHKFYVSNSTISFNENNKTFEIITYIFTDDLEYTLQKKYNSKIDISHSRLDKKHLEHIKNYFLSQFEIVADRNPLTLKFIGTEYDASGLTKCYVESSKVKLKKITELKFTNTLLTDIFDSQKNIMNINIYSLKKTIYTTKDEITKTINVKKVTL